MGFEGWNAGSGWIDKGSGLEWIWFRFFPFLLGRGGRSGLVPGAGSSSFAGWALVVGNIDILMGQKWHKSSSNACALITLSKTSWKALLELSFLSSGLRSVCEDD